jgi:hypothetical protein
MISHQEDTLKQQALSRDVNQESIGHPHCQDV